MNCKCMIDFEPDDYVTKIDDTTPTAQKEHSCCECGRVIAIGEKYRNEKTKFAGKLTIYKTCLDCISLRENLFCSGWYYEGIREMVADEISENGTISESCIAQLTPNAREFVCELIEKYQKDMEENE